MKKMAMALIAVASLILTSFTLQAATIASGDKVQVALKEDGSLWGWGLNNGWSEEIKGAIGPETLGRELHWPVKIMDEVEDFSLWYAKKTDNSLWSFKGKPYKILDDVERWYDGSYGAFEGCAIKKDGTLWAWGSTWRIDNGERITTKIPAFEVAYSIADVMVTWSSLYALNEQGALWRYMLSDKQELISVKVAEDVKSLVKNQYDSDMYFVIKSDYSLWAWEEKTDSKPILSKLMEDCKSIFHFNGNYYAIKTDDSLWAWGQNSYGQLGIGSTKEQKTPRKIMDHVTGVFFGGYSTSYIKRSDNSLWACGMNDGFFGNGRTNNTTVPLKIMDDVAKLYTSFSDMDESFNAFAIKTDGSLWAWGNKGSNWRGLWGNGTYTSGSQATKVLDHVVDLSFGWAYALALREDGSLWSWGENVCGVIGDGTANVYDPNRSDFTKLVDNNRPNPVKIMEGLKKSFDD